MEISRDSECNEPQVVRGFPQDRQGHSRNHVEEGCERERKDGTFHRDNTTTWYDAPLHTNKHGTSWRFDLASSWRLDTPSGSWQDTHGTLGPLRRKAVGKVILARPSRHSTTRTFTSGTSGPRWFPLTLSHERIRRRI